MAEHWERRRILIWGKTRPELSAKYREIVCTGGVFEDTKCLVRLYPIPLRYLEDERVAFVSKSPKDPRPETALHRIGIAKLFPPSVEREK